jgi:hypothetical protein
MASYIKLSFFATLLALASGAEAAPSKKEVFARQVCAAAVEQSAVHSLDANFFVRLLWKESMFDPNAVSPKGAQGIAQFMPDTAERVGLADPFDPVSAVAASAKFLAGLKRQFGNLGLAAAAYNAGEGRVDRWKAGKSGMPLETQDYVAFITGKAVEDWKEASASFPIPAVGNEKSVGEACVQLALRLKPPKSSGLRVGNLQPWGALIAANFKQNQALAMFKRMQVRFPEQLQGKQPMVVSKRNLSMGSRAMAMVMIGAKTREQAQAICAGLTAAGAPCVVRRVK